MNKKYPTSLFFAGVLMNLTKNFYLFIPGVILLLIGLWNKACLSFGALLLFVDIVVSFVEQLKIKNVCETSDDPNFLSIQDAILDKNWRKNIIEMTEQRMRDHNLDSNEDNDEK